MAATTVFDPESGLFIEGIQQNLDQIEQQLQVEDTNYGICYDHGLGLLAALVDDTEGIRKSTQNRLRQAITKEPDSDGITRGLGLPPDHLIVITIREILEIHSAAEKQAIKQLEKRMKAHPLGPWVTKTPGIGLKQGARLLAAIGDPYWHVKQGRPRTVSELWSYAGYSTRPVDPDSELFKQGQLSVAVRRRRGEKANWSSNAKTRAYLVAESCMKSVGSGNRPRSPYRDVYEARREHTAVTHPEWTDGHSHNDALRIAAKAILKGLWRAARDIHDQANGVESPEE
jgi:hypothetical protein